MKAPKADLAVSVVLVAACLIYTFRVTDARSSSANAMVFIQCRFLPPLPAPLPPQRPQRQVQPRQQRQVVRPQAVDGSTSTSAFALIVRPSGPRCSTMAGGR